MSEEDMKFIIFNALYIIGAVVIGYLAKPKTLKEVFAYTVAAIILWMVLSVFVALDEVVR